MQPTAFTLDLPEPADGAARSSRRRIYLLEARYEFLKLLRSPHFAVPVIAFPVMFFVLFGLSFGSRTAGAGVGPREHLLASYSVFGVVTAALFAFGAGVAVERAQGWLSLKRATPMPPTAYFAAKVASAMAFGAIILACMAVVAIAAGGVRLPLLAWVRLLSVMVAGCVPFCLAGLVIAFTVPPAGAPGIVNLINLPLAFAGGLWVPVDRLPPFVRALAPGVPQYHLGQLALGAVGGSWLPGTGLHILALAGWSAALAAAARWAYRRGEGRSA
jgi:ABC-2 type transport system permease protein